MSRFGLGQVACGLDEVAFGRGNPISPEGIEVRAAVWPLIMEDIAMFARKGVFSSVSRGAAMVAVAAIALTAVEPSVASAGSAPRGKVVAVGSSGMTDISARRRLYHGGGAAAAAAFAGIVGTGLAIAATQNRRSYYDDGYYGSGPGYYGGGPVYFGGRPVYSGNNRDPRYSGYGYNGDP